MLVVIGAHWSKVWQSKIIKYMNLDNTSTLRIIIPREPEYEFPKCIICLNDAPIITTYSGSCACHPHIHEQCLAQWFAENPEVCPICRIKYSTDIVVIPQQRENIRYHLCACLFCCFICTLPFAVIVFIAIFKGN